MQPWGELMSACGMNFGTLERVELEVQVGRNLPSHFTWGVDCARPSGTHASLGSTLGPRYLCQPF